MRTKGDTISSVRRLLKGDTLDAFLTDRFIYSQVLTIARLFIKQKDDRNTITRYSSLFQKYPGVPLVETSPIEAGCIGLKVCCTFKRSEEPLPKILEGSWGPIFRNVSSVDGSTILKQTDPKTWAYMTHSTTFKYNKTKYFWFLGDYVYFPDLPWSAVDVDAMWEDDISEFFCDAPDCCVDRLTEATNIPDDLFAQIEDQVRQKLMGMAQIPPDPGQDNKSVLR